MATQPVSQPVTLSSAAVAIYINDKPYNQAQSISWNISWGVKEIWGIDSPFPQEIADGRASISIRIQAVAIDYNQGGMQNYNATTLIGDILQAPYSALRVVNRKNGDTLLYVPNCRVSDESIDSTVKQSVKYSFTLKGLVFYTGLDLAYGGRSSAGNQTKI